jgi:hypothetical protein
MKRVAVPRQDIRGRITGGEQRSHQLKFRHFRYHLEDVIVSTYYIDHPQGKQ